MAWGILLACKSYPTMSQQLDLWKSLPRALYRWSLQVQLATRVGDHVQLYMCTVGTVWWLYCDDPALGRHGRLTLVGRHKSWRKEEKRRCQFHHRGFNSSTMGGGGFNSSNMGGGSIVPMGAINTTMGMEHHTYYECVCILLFGC